MTKSSSNTAKAKKKASQAALSQFNPLKIGHCARIASYLWFEEQSNLALTCKSMREAVQEGPKFPIEGFKRSYLQQSPPLLPHFPKWVSERSKVVKLEYSDNLERIKTRLELHPNATRLTIFGNIYNTDNVFPKATPERMNNFFQVILSTSVRKKIEKIELAPGIYLKDREWWRQNFSSFDAACLTQFPNLRKIDFFEFLSPENIIKMSPILPQIEWISLGRSKITDFAFLGNCTNLRVLWAGNSKISDREIEYLHRMGILQNLETLDLSGCLNITAESAKFLVDCSKVKYLYLPEIDLNSFDLLRPLFAHLIHLKLGNCSFSKKVCALSKDDCSGIVTSSEWKETMKKSTLKYFDLVVARDVKKVEIEKLLKQMFHMVKVSQETHDEHRDRHINPVF